MTVEPEPAGDAQQLIVLRHAEPVGWADGIADIDRPLSANGRAHAGRIASFLSGLDRLPQCILCSVAVRTRQTLEPTLEANPGLTAVTRFRRDIYNASFSTLVRLLDAAFAEFRRVMIVGHNPGMASLVSELARRPGGASWRGFPAGTLAFLEMEDGWRFGSRCATVGRWLAPEDLSGN